MRTVGELRCHGEGTRCIEQRRSISVLRLCSRAHEVAEDDLDMAGRLQRGSSRRASPALRLTAWTQRVRDAIWSTKGLPPCDQSSNRVQEWGAGMTKPRCATFSSSGPERKLRRQALVRTTEEGKRGPAEVGDGVIIPELNSPARTLCPVSMNLEK
ncbi:hypothetical protein BC628DRAFT_1360541 [Trametes gibbosa]|nr:hypothetical protein BC628DRAFT_1360541 [Trametes gibbosa]